MNETVSFAVLPGLTAAVFLPLTWKSWSCLPVFLTENVTVPVAADGVGSLRASVVRDLRLRSHGLRAVEPDMVAFAPSAEGPPVTLWRDPGRTATELVANDAAHLVWAVNLGVVDFNPHPVRRSDLDCPDELRVDLDPMPGVRWNTVRKVAMCVKDVLEEHGLAGYPKTSGSRGIHVNVRIEPRWDYVLVRRAALALAREVERRAPALATSAWWKEERHGVFIDYNQNAKDRTTAGAWSVRLRTSVTVSGWLSAPGVWGSGVMPARAGTT